MPSQHTVRSYDEELKFLTHKIAEMGGHAERMVEQSVAAIVNADNALAQRVISDDLILDASEREIDDKAVMIIAKRQPMAVDLREIIGSIRISADLERVGDLGKNIAKRVAAVSESRQPVKLYRGLETLAELALTQLRTCSTLMRRVRCSRSMSSVTAMTRSMPCTRRCSANC